MKSNLPLSLVSVAVCTLLTACGGGSSSSTTTPTSPTPTPTPTEPTASVQGAIHGPHSTGSLTEPKYVYFDLDTQAVVELTEEQAANDTQWDIAFRRTKIYLNQHSDNGIKVHATGHNSDFFDESGAPIVDSFVNATAESNLAAYLAVKTSDIPTDENAFGSDVTSHILEGFFHYDFATHVVSVMDSNYFVVHSDDAFAKYRVTAIETVGQALGQLTIANAYQGPGDVEFHQEQEFTVDLAAICGAGDAAAYIDLDINQQVTADDNWDIHIPCKADNSGAEFAMHIADDAQALRDFDNIYTAMDPAAMAFYGFEADSFTVNAFDGFEWYQYGINGGRLLWSQFDIYLVQTPTSTYKLQITSYYDAEGTSGNYSFRADEVEELAGVEQ